MQTNSSRGMLFVLALLVFGVSACSVPNVKVSDPSALGNLGQDNVSEAANISTAIAAVKTAAKAHDEKFVPPIAELNNAGRDFSFLASMFAGCGEMRRPITDSYRGNLQLLGELRKAEEALADSSPVTEKDRRIVEAGKILISKMQVASALVLRDSLPDADGYLASCEGRILSHLSAGNRDSMEKTLRQVEEAGQRVNAAKSAFVAALN